MQGNRFAFAEFWSLVPLLGISTIAFAQQEISIEQASEAAQLYFSSGAAYQSGDLISRSQIGEFQSYLRNTRRLSALSHPILLKLALADESPLVQLFYAKDGKDVLRTAAAKLGGYASLEQTVLTNRGRRALLEAIETHSADAAIESVEQFFPKNSSKQSDRHLFKDRIYTVEDLLDRAFSAAK